MEKGSEDRSKKKYRIIMAATLMNSVTIRDVMIPPEADEFIEDFFGMAIYSYLDFFLGYD